ncbi:type II toxin-antitoxin system RelE/ParE family toxin [Bremerella sp. JC770]|uniref:type II toxin-antitoxin system RelE/ParE family toxin n=1 Tax=Bremerella sp. JC770 TaxID=3232137 RepID=UPI0034585B45
MRQVYWTITAQQELDDIIRYIGNQGRRYLVAESLYFEIKQRLQDQLERNLPGHFHQAAPPDWLYVQHKRWLIFYRVIDEGFEIMRIVDGSRDLPNVL